MPVYLGFSAHIWGRDYPAAVFKLDGGEAYCWHGDQPGDGYLAIFDLEARKRHLFSAPRNEHHSRHKSGERRQTLECAGKKVRIGVRKDSPSHCIVSWSAIRLVTVPLTEPFDFWPVEFPMWSAVEFPHTLRREDFGENVDGVLLDGYICRHTRVDDLLFQSRRTSARSWIAGDGEFDLVVLAEVVKIPSPIVRA